MILVDVSVQHLPDRIHTLRRGACSGRNTQRDLAEMLLDRTEGVLPASKAEFRRVVSQNAALAAQNAALSSVTADLAAQDLALSKRDDRLQAEIDVLVKELNDFSPVHASNLCFHESVFLRYQARNCFQV